MCSLSAIYCKVTSFVCSGTLRTGSQSTFVYEASQKIAILAYGTNNMEFNPIVCIGNVNDWKFTQGSPFIKGIIKPLKYIDKYVRHQMTLNIAVFCPNSTFVSSK